MLDIILKHLSIRKTDVKIEELINKNRLNKLKTNTSNIFFYSIHKKYLLYI